MEAPQLQFNVEDKYNLAEYYNFWVGFTKEEVNNADIVPYVPS